MTIRAYSSPEAFKQALEQRLRASAKSGAEFARKRQLLVFDRSRGKSTASPSASTLHRPARDRAAHRREALYGSRPCDDGVHENPLLLIDRQVQPLATFGGTRLLREPLRVNDGPKLHL